MCRNTIARICLLGLIVVTFMAMPIWVLADPATPAIETATASADPATETPETVIPTATVSFQAAAVPEITVNGSSDPLVTVSSTDASTLSVNHIHTLNFFPNGSCTPPVGGAWNLEGNPYSQTAPAADWQGIFGTTFSVQGVDANGTPITTCRTIVIGSAPTNTPTETPTNVLTNTPTETPTSTPTHIPTNTPTETPTNTPTETPTNTPTEASTNTPTGTPTNTSMATATTAPARGSLIARVETSNGRDLPDGISLCVGNECQPVGMIANTGMLAMRHPSGSGVVFSNLPPGRAVVSARGVTGSVLVSQEVVIPAGDAVTVRLVLPDPPTPVPGPVTSLPNTGSNGGTGTTSPVVPRLPGATVLLLLAGVATSRRRRA